ncbi:MAG: hypothetical protein GX219_02905 [Tissierellia bacterium]|nr:hypothetical protein [Tissierellia bacterium]
MEKFDARGRSCPEPVIITQRELKNHPEGIIVMVDTPVSKENVTRYANNEGYTVSVEESGEDFTLTIKK